MALMLGNLSPKKSISIEVSQRLYTKRFALPFFSQSLLSIAKDEPNNCLSAPRLLRGRNNFRFDKSSLWIKFKLRYFKPDSFSRAGLRCYFCESKPDARNDDCLAGNIAKMTFTDCGPPEAFNFTLCYSAYFNGSQHMTRGCSNPTLLDRPDYKFGWTVKSCTSDLCNSAQG